MIASNKKYSTKEAFYKALIDQSQDVFLILDEQGNYKFAGDSVETLLGYQPAELVGTNILDLVHEEDKQELLAVLNNRLITPPDKAIDFRYKAKSGNYKWLGALVSNQFNNPEINGLLLNARNVTDRKELQVKFKRRTRRFKLLFENSPDIITYETVDGVIADVNQAFLQTIGLPKSEVIGQTFSEYLEPEVANVCFRYFQEALVGTTVRFDLALVAKNGIAKIFDTIKFPVVIDEQIVGVYTIAKDITPMVEAYETIQQQAKKLNTIFESITDAFFTLDNNLDFTYINNEFGKILQIDPKELIGTYIWDFFSKDLADKFLEQHDSAMEYKQAVHFEALYKKLNLWLEVKAFRSEDGMSVYFSDITRQKHLELQEALGKKVLEQNAKPDSNLPDLITSYLKGLDELYPGMIAAIMSLKGDKIYSLASLSLPPEFVEAVNGVTIGPNAGSCGTAAYLKKKIVVSDIAHDPLWADFKDEALKYNLKACWSLPIIGSNQKVLGTFAVFYQDVKKPTAEEEEVIDKARNVLQLIMENKVAAQALKESNDRFKLATNATEDVIYDWDLVTGNLVWGDSLTKLFGIRSEEIEYSIDFWEKFAHPEDGRRILQSLDKDFADPTVTYWQEEYRMIRANGEVIYVLDKGNIVRNENKQAIRMVGAMHDITDRKRSELEKEHLIEQLMQRNKSLQQFTHIVSHNLRAPVARLLGLTSVFNMPQADQATKETVLKGISDSAQNLDTVIKDLNQILTIRGNIDQIKETLQFEEEVTAVTRLIQEDLDRCKVNLRTDFSRASTVNTVRSYLQSILYNLLSNAVKYRRPDCKVEISVSTSIENDYIVLEVKDNGTGIDLEKQKDKIFGLYKRFHTDIDGKGLGLFMVKSQIEALGGKVEVQSKVNDGTTFKVYFKE